MPIADKILFAVIHLAVFLFLLSLALYLFKKNNRLAYLVAFLLIVHFAYVGVTTTAISGDPATKAVCASCQEALTETYPYCPYCGEEVTPADSP